jgi:hypothetical protein
MKKKYLNVTKFFKLKKILNINLLIKKMINHL